MNSPSEPLHLAQPRSLSVETIEPEEHRKLAPGHWFFDFGKAAFGTLQLTLTASQYTALEVHLGEKLTSDGSIDREPPGCVRYRCVSAAAEEGTNTMRLEIPPDERNTGAVAIKMPDDLFEVLPFRYAEIITDSAPEPELRDVTQLAVFYPFDYAASGFNCDNESLNRVWELCKYSIKATSFCGIYVDGDRERIPYEADAYINQLCHYGVDAEYEMARQSIEYLLFHPTWPTDWTLHCVPMAWADYQYTGRMDLWRSYYDVLRRKALLPLAREDGLISTETGLLTDELLADIFRDGKPLRDNIDWPRGERDDYDMVPVKTVINSLHIWNLRILANIASVLGKEQEAKRMHQQAEKATASLIRVCFDPERGVFVDGETSEHASLHANIFPAALGLVPEGAETTVLQFIRSRGMACSVYCAQYLLEACYRLDDPEYALDLMTATHDRSWLNMLRVGSTVTLEAWDHQYKNNLDWNHAWGAAPANIIPRFVAGVRPAKPGFSEAVVAPRPGPLKHLEITVPTQHGPVYLKIDPLSEGKRRVQLETPVPASVDLSGLESREASAYAVEAAFQVAPGKYEWLTGG